MKNPEKYKESFIQTIVRTIITSAIIALILNWLHVFHSAEKSKILLFEIIWLVVFCIVFGGHWLELLFINRIKFALPKSKLLLIVSRIVFWYLCSIPLFFCGNFIIDLFSQKTAHLGQLWIFGFCFIGIELFMHALMQIRNKKSFYNGVY